MKKKQFHYKLGFTLIELLLYVSVFSILLLVFIQLFGVIIDTQLEYQSNSEVDEDGRFILNRLTYDISRAQSILQPSSVGATSSSLQLSINGVTNTYALSTSNLQLTNSSGSDNLNGFGTTVSTISFKRIGSAKGKDSIQIGFTAVSKILRKNGYDTRSYQTTSGLR